MMISVSVQSLADAAVVDKSPTSLQQYLVAHYTTLRNRLALRLGCPNLASECLHDTWLRLAEVSVPATVENPGAYVYRIACNLATDRVRNSKPWQYIADADLELEQVADSTPGPAMIAEARSELDEVMRILQRLPLRHRSVLLKLRLEEESREEVANRYGVSSRRVDKLLRQALDFCIEETEQTAPVGETLPRKELAPRWLHTPKMYDGKTAARG